MKVESLQVVHGGMADAAWKDLMYQLSLENVDNIARTLRRYRLEAGAPLAITRCRADVSFRRVDEPKYSWELQAHEPIPCDENGVPVATCTWWGAVHSLLNSVREQVGCDPNVVPLLDEVDTRLEALRVATLRMRHREQEQRELAEQLKASSFVR